MDMDYSSEVDDDDDDSSDADQSDNDTSADSDDTSDTDSSADATQDEQDDHRAALGSLIDNLQSRGIDVDQLAQEAGVDTSDVNALEHDDAMTLTKYIASTHPELTQSVFSRFPVAQGLLGRFLGN